RLKRHAGAELLRLLQRKGLAFALQNQNPSPFGGSRNKIGEQPLAWLPSLLKRPPPFCYVVPKVRGHLKICLGAIRLCAIGLYPKKTRRQGCDPRANAEPKIC